MSKGKGKLRLAWVNFALSFLFLIGNAASVLGQTLDERSLETIEKRLSAPSDPRRPVEAGDVVFLTHAFTINANRLSGPATQYEGLMRSSTRSRSVKVHQRVEDLRFVPKGSKVTISYTFAVEIGPKVRKSARVRASFILRERTGLLNTVEEVKHRKTLRVKPARPTPRDLSADFLGYRYYRDRAAKRMANLNKAGLRLSLESEGPIPAATGLSAKGMLQLWAFEKERRRVWKARRHLDFAARFGPRKRRKQAKALLAALDATLPAAELGQEQGLYAQLPLVPLYSTKAKLPVSKETDSGTLEPVSEYRSGEDGTIQLPTDAPNKPEIAQVPPAEDKPVAPLAPPSIEPSGLDEVSVGLQPVPASSADFDRRVQRYYLPTYQRSLTLDDPNIGFGGAVRASYADVSFPEQANVLTIFYSAQASLTRDLGVEVVVPTQFVSIEVGAVDESLYRFGNPMVSLKYRFHLPTIFGRQPSLTTRARWGLGVFQRTQIPRTDLTLEQFSSLPNFPDTHAFLPERTSLGGGFNLAWSHKWFHLGGQFYADYIFPSDIALEQIDLLSLAYGGALGLSPGLDWATAYVEGRATSFVVGASRTEVVAYGGIRFQFLQYFEPAVWVGVPIGSIADVTSIQGGLEFRIHYERRAIVQIDERRKEQP